MHLAFSLPYLERLFKGGTCIGQCEHSLWQRAGAGAGDKRAPMVSKKDKRPETALVPLPFNPSSRAGLMHTAWASVSSQADKVISTLLLKPFLWSFSLKQPQGKCEPPAGISTRRPSTQRRIKRHILLSSLKIFLFQIFFVSCYFPLAFNYLPSN